MTAANYNWRGMGKRLAVKVKAERLTLDQLVKDTELRAGDVRRVLNGRAPSRAAFQTYQKLIAFTQTKPQTQDR